MVLLCLQLFRTYRFGSVWSGRWRTALLLQRTRYSDDLRLCGGSVRLFSRLSCGVYSSVPCAGVRFWGSVLVLEAQKLHTSARRPALPPAALLLLIKPLQKLTAIILGRSIRKWWKALPPNKKRLLQEWAWHRRWILSGAAVGLSIFISLFLLTHSDQTPVTGRSRLLFFSWEDFMQLAQHASEECNEEYRDSFIAVSDPRHQAVEQVVQHLVRRNQDIEGMMAVPWTVHVVESPELNAFVLPNGEIFVFSGMLAAIADIHQLAFVLGHEMSHAIMGHAAEQTSLSHVLDLLSLILLTMIWAICPHDSLAILGQWIQSKLVKFLFDRPYSRKLEAEADQVGLQLAAKACADVRAAPVFWQQMELGDQLSEDFVVPEWLSTHPSHHNRIIHLDRLIPEALELRTKCDCPALPATDPRSVFSKTVQLLLDANNRKLEAQSIDKEQRKTPMPSQHRPQVGMFLTASVLPQTRLNYTELTETSGRHKALQQLDVNKNN